MRRGMEDLDSSCAAALAVEQQEGAVASAGALSPTQLGAVKTLLRMCGSTKEDALEPLRKLVDITDDEWKSVLEQLRREYEISRLNPYLKNKSKRGRKAIGFGGRHNKPGHKAGRPKKKKKDSEGQPSLAEAFGPPEDEDEDEDFEAADDVFGPDDEHLIGGADDSEIYNDDDDEDEERQELVRQRLEEYLKDIPNSTMVQTPSSTNDSGDDGCEMAPDDDSDDDESYAPSDDEDDCDIEDEKWESDDEETKDTGPDKSPNESPNKAKKT